MTMKGTILKGNNPFLLLLLLMLRFFVPASGFAPTTTRRTLSFSIPGAASLRLPFAPFLSFEPPRLQQQRKNYSVTAIAAKPKRGAVVESYRSVSVNCSKCRQRLFRYKKKNGTKSNLVKCYVERIAEDSAGILEQEYQKLISSSNNNNDASQRSWNELVQDLPLGYGLECPHCHSQFARAAQIHGLPALKMVGGKVTMTKK